MTHQTFGALLSFVTAFLSLAPFLISPKSAPRPVAVGGGGGGGPIGGGGGAIGGGGGGGGPNNGGGGGPNGGGGGPIGGGGGPPRGCEETIFVDPTDVDAFIAGG